MGGLRQDIRFALRQTARSPLLSAVAVLVLTLGIGTNVVVFTVLDGILLRPPPGVGDTEGLVEISSIPTGAQGSSPLLTYGEFLAYRDEESVFEEVAVYRATRVAWHTGEGQETVRAELASSGYFEALDVRMELGREFVLDDDGPLRERSSQIVVGHAHWRGAMDGAPDVLGRTIEVEGHPYTVVGVAPERFYGAGGGDDPVAFWLPTSDQPLLFPEQEDLLTGERRAFRAVARLRDGVTRDRAQAVAQTRWQRVERSAQVAGDTERRRIRITPYRGPGSRRMDTAFAFVAPIGGLVGSILLLIACTNAGGLLLARALRRRREIGIRLALGAGRRRIIRQLLTESALLAAVAGVAGTALTLRGLDTLERTLFTFPLDLEPSFATLALALSVTGATALVSGLAPALHATRAAVFDAMKDRVAGIDLKGSRMRGAFTVTQLALSLPLLTAAALLIGGLAAQVGGDPGFDDPRSLLVLRVDYDRAGYSADEVDPLLTSIRDRVVALPGVTEAAFTSVPPLPWPPSFGFVRVPPVDGGAARARRPVFVGGVDPESFATLGIPILRGRAVQPSDVPGAPLAAVVDEEVARRAWPGEDPLGRTLTMELAAGETSFTVVGVAGRISLFGDPSNPTPVVYGSRWQLRDTTSMTLVVRTVGAARDLAPETRRQVLAVDPDLVIDVTVLSDRLRATRTELSHASTGAGACAVIALLLACIGLYGMIATGVAERTREVGVRMALGADHGQIVGHFVRRGMTLALMALGVGLPLSWAVVAVVGSNVVGVTALEPEVLLALAAITILLLAVALVSSSLPARRSSSVDPVLALRAD